VLLLPVEPLTRFALHAHIKHMARTEGIERTERLHMLLSTEESEMLKALANHKGLSTSDYLRQVIRDAWSRCGWCGAPYQAREWKGPRKAWRMKDGLHICADCYPSVPGAR
jgi:hypothetical protein